MVISPLKYAHCEYPLPVRHRPKVPFHPRIVTPPGLVERSRRIHELDRELDRFILREKDYLDLVTEAFSSNLHFSSKLEGNPLPLDEVRRLTLNSFEGAEVGRVRPPQREILNALLVWFEPRSLATPWAVETLRAVHASLMEGVDPDARSGELRGEETIVRGPRGEGHFVTAPPELVPRELGSLVEWVNTSAGSLLPEVAATLFFHEFESIHPFLDGNGRAGRTLFHGYLVNHGLPNANLCPVEAKLLGNPELYYRILGWTDHSGGYLELVDFFTQALHDSYEETAERFRTKDLLEGPLDETAKRLLARAKAHAGWFSLRDAAAWVGGRGEQTVRRYLNVLVQEGAMHAEGRTRSKRYRFADPLVEFRRRATARQAPIQTRLVADEPAPPRAAGRRGRRRRS